MKLCRSKLSMARLNNNDGEKKKMLLLKWREPLQREPLHCKSN